ncbi:MAG: glycosyltransferase family 4 protein [Christensenellales bacterium]
MKILIVTPEFWPDRCAANDIADAFFRAWHDVTVLTGREKSQDSNLEENTEPLKPPHRDIKIYRTAASPRKNGKPSMTAALRFGIEGRKLVKSINTKFDAVMAYEPLITCEAWPAVEAAEASRAPLALRLSELWPDRLEAAGASGGITKLAVKRSGGIYAHSDAIIAASMGFIDRLRAYGYEGPIAYIPKWVEGIENIVPEYPSDTETHPLPEGFRIVYIGGIGEAQSWDTVLSAAKLLKESGVDEVKWVLIGDGSARAGLEQRVLQEGLDSIVFKDMDKTSHVPFWLATASAALVTFKRKKEFFLLEPPKIQSYFAHGVPVIASVEGEGARIVNSARAGVACEPENPRALVDAVMKLYKMDEGERAQLGDNGKAYYGMHYSKMAVVSGILTTIELLADHEL